MDLERTFRYYWLVFEHNCIGVALAIGEQAAGAYSRMACKIETTLVTKFKQ